MTINSNIILNHLHHPVIVFDTSLRVQYLSPAAESLFSISFRRAKNTDSFAKLPANGKHTLGEYLRNAFERRRTITHHELRIDIPDQFRNMTIGCTLSTIEEQAFDTLLLMEIVPLDRTLRIADEARILKQQQDMREIIRGMAHEIKNPLGGMRGAAQLLEKENGDNPLTSIIIKEVDRLQTLVDKMLGPNQKPNKVALNVHNVLNHIAQLIQMESDTIQFVMEYDPSLPEIWADENKLTQALLNIVRNACEATANRIILRTRAHHRFTLGKQTHRLVMMIEIIDNGPGIPKTLIDKIFYPMVTGRSEGTGLGLSISQTLINQHGGLIKCASRVGETTFSVFIPLDNHPQKETHP